MEKTKIFTRAGLTDNESRVYQILLENEKLSVGDLIKITSFKRGNLYNILYSLTSKNLIEEFIYRKKKYFRALNPQKLRDYIGNKRNKLRQVASEIDKILPNLIKNFQLSSQKPGVYYYDGIEGIKNIYVRILKEKKDLRVFVSEFERKNPEINKILNDQIIKQNKTGIKVKGISAHKYKKKDLIFLHQNNSYPRIVNNLKLDSEILVFGNNVSITTFKKDYFTTLIINDQIAQTIKCIFDVMYEKAQEPKTIKKVKNDVIKIKIS